MLTTLSVSHLRPVPATTRHDLLLYCPSLLLSLQDSVQIKLAETGQVDDKAGFAEIRLLARPGRGLRLPPVWSLSCSCRPSCPTSRRPRRALERWCAWTRTRERVGPSLFFVCTFFPLVCRVCCLSLGEGDARGGVSFDLLGCRRFLSPSSIDQLLHGISFYQIC